jgi:light-regulated signal transduction histidine kinase (bacteriophytochrome)
MDKQPTSNKPKTVGPNDGTQQGNRELEQFARAVSHDMKTTLWIMGFCCERLQSKYRGQLDPETESFVDGASRAVKKSGQMLDSLLEYVRVDSTERNFSTVNCETVFSQAQLILQEAIDNSGAQITHDPLPTLEADAGQLLRVFVSLLDNAIRYRRDEPPRIHVGVQPTDGEWEFQVQDNGLGIESRFGEHIFQICTRLQKEEDQPGSGMGLALSRRIVEWHGGRIWVESTPKQGSVFHFTLPQSTASPATTTDPDQ